MTTFGKKAPLAMGIPLVGSMFDMLPGHIPALVRMRNKYGDVVRIKAGPPGIRFEMYGVFSPSGVAQVLGDTALFTKDGKGYSQIRELMPNGLMTSRGETHDRQRRTVQPLFNNRTVDTYAYVVGDEVRRLTRRWGDVVDVHQASSELSLRVVTRSLMGADIEDVVSEYAATFPWVNKLMLRRMMRPHNVPLSWPTPANLKIRRLVERFSRSSDKVIRSRLDRTVLDESDMVSLLTRAADEDGAQLDAAELRDHVHTFLFAGNESVGNCLAFALHHLGKDPDMQEKCRAEVAAQLGGRTPTASDVVGMPFLTAVVKETLRLYPPSPQLERTASRETRIDGYGIPAGAVVWLSPWVTHRDPAYWPDPERFDPDRFAAGADTSHPRYAYYPFGGGAQGCIGQYYSMVVIVLSLALMLRDYRLEALDRNLRVIHGITTMPQGSMRCRVTRVDA